MYLIQNYAMLLQDWISNIRIVAMKGATANSEYGKGELQISNAWQNQVHENRQANFRALNY